MTLTISAGELSYYASSRFCSRCAWVRRHVRPLPYQSFPAIFSAIDRYTKLIVHSHFDRDEALPPWLGALGEVQAYIKPPHWRKYSITDQATGATLRGEADGIFRMVDGSITIVDYKTSSYTSGQKAMFPGYEVQLNAYAYIGERLDLRPVRQLALVYMEPQADEGTARAPQLVGNAGFSMMFEGTVVPVELKPDRLIPPLLRRACEIGDMETPPERSLGCSDCDAMDGLMGALT